MSNVAPCLACGKPVDTTVKPGMPKHEPLCDIECIKAWCEQTGSKFLTMEEYAAERARKQPRASAN